MKLKNYNNDGLELVIDLETGEAFASISAAARMTDKNESSIRSYVKSALETSRKMTLLEAEILTTTGLKTSRLLNESQILEVVNKYKPDLLIKFAQAGLRVFLHQLAGYKVSSTAVVQPEVNQTNRQVSLELAESIRTITDTLDDNPRIAQLLIDNALMDIRQHQITGTELKGVVEIATSMGFKVDASSRSRLGKFIKSCGFEPQKEKRICNGQMREINCYIETEELRNTISAFFDK